MKSTLPMRWIAPLLLIAAIFTIYRPSLDFGFVWDDNLYVVHNEAVKDWSRAGEAFTSPATTWGAGSQYNLSAWRPLRNISYLIDFSLFGLNPIGWHLHNVLLHCAAAVLLFFLIRRLFLLFGTDGEPSSKELPASTDWICLLATAWWALHPVQTEVVAWVKSRDDLLAAPLFLGALLLALPRQRNIPRPGLLPFLASIIFYIAALLSKENTVVFAAIYLLIVGWALLPVSTNSSPPSNASTPVKPSRRSKLRWAFWTTFAIGLVSLAFLAVRDIMLGRTAQAAHPGTASETILTMLYAFARYMRLVLWPWAPTVQSADYDAFPLLHSWTNPAALAGLALLLGIIAVACAAARRSRLVSTGIAIFLLAMLPFSNIIPMMQIMAERFLYLPTIGLAIAGAAVLYGTTPGSLVRKTAIGVGIVIVAGLAAQTHVRLPVWENELTLFKATRDANPTSWRPADHYAKSLLKDGQTTAGLTVADENLARWPFDPDIVRTAALAHLLAGDEPGGLALTARAVELQPDDARASQTLRKWRALLKKKVSD